MNYGRYWTTRPKALKVWYKYESGIIDIIGKRPVGDNTQVGDNDRCEIAISVGNWDYKKMGGNPESPVYVNTTEGRYYTEKSDGVIAFGHHVSNQSCDWTQIEILLNYKTSPAPQAPNSGSTKWNWSIDGIPFLLVFLFFLNHWFEFYHFSLYLCRVSVED